MGNDGGSIPDRRDLVKSKPKAEQADKANQTRARWFFCALSKASFTSFAYRVFNNRSDRGNYRNRSCRDVKKLTLDLNPSRALTPDGSERPQFICPLTLKEMNGLVPFIYLSTCGCTFSQAGLKNVAVSPTTSSDELSLCPQCAKKYSPAMDIIQLNPNSEDEERLREAMERRRLLEPPPKKSGKKRKAAADGNEELPKKKREELRPSTNPSIAAASQAVVSSLAMEEAKRKAGMSEAVKSLYDSADREKRKETFMTMGTFTRYA
ncbi:hypothetical protein H0H87_002048 [Tephrocybe sp. NHM501043]|nr:hypothetical protein H0H87_002048 [Tephrocybe sp. NHM501043]